MQQKSVHQDATLPDLTLDLKEKKKGEIETLILKRGEAEPYRIRETGRKSKKDVHRTGCGGGGDELTTTTSNIRQR
jgi:hypothetical protein